MSGIRFIRPLDKFQPPTKCWCSPSGLGVDTGCMRQLLIDSYFRHNGMYDSAHTKFGSALGAACATLVEHYSEPSWLRIAHAYDAARRFFKPSDEIPGKNWAKLWRCIHVFDQQWAFKHKERWRFHSSELKVTLEITETGFTNRLLTGSYDLKVVRNVGGQDQYKIIDFKAVSSAYFYSFDTDTQTPLYTLLDYISGLSKGVRNSYQSPEYYVFEVGRDDMKLDMTIVQVLPTVLSTSLVGSLATHRLASQYAAMLTQLVTQNPNAVDTLWDSIPINASQCKRGTFKCFQYSVCHEGMPVNFDKPRYAADADTGYHIQLTSNELTSFAHELGANFASSKSAPDQITLDEFGGYTLEELMEI